MRDLNEIQRRRRPGGPPRMPRAARAVNTPLVEEAWRKGLIGHPDQRWAKYITTGIREGFRVGFRHREVECRGAKRNMMSAYENPQVVSQYLAKEVSLGRVAGPYDKGECPGLHISRFGAIPKPHQPGKFRLILDLSHPEGHSVNDGIEAELCSVQYASVGEAVRRILTMEKGGHLTKIDIESAYRIVPVHPEDRGLMGMEWEGKRYIDLALPFGLRSAPKIFNVLGDALQWMLEKEGIENIHYLDDFLVFGPGALGECRQQVRELMRLFERLGVPIACHKTEGPARMVTFLGILLDLVARVLKLPEEKLARLMRMIKGWGDRKSCTKRELLSLIGSLQHACCVVRPGRTFLRRMIDLAASVKGLHHIVRLNKGFRSDLQWWACFLPKWNGTSMMSGLERAERVAGTITSDASGGWGCGAFTSTGEWFQLRWPASWAGVHITIKELVPVVLGLALWGQQWKGQTVRCLCDNAAVVADLNSGRSKDERVMHLLRALFLVVAKHSIYVVGEHIPGVDNGAADALSRDRLPVFLQMVPEAATTATAIPEELVDALVVSQPDWTEPSWNRRLGSLLLRD